jgi:hypothetical protein
VSTFAGPSAPAIVGLRMAPVTTIGVSPEYSRSITQEVSSIVSVPWVTTAPITAPEATSCSISSTTATTSEKPKEAPGIPRTSYARTRIPVEDSPGTEATRSAAARRGTTPLATASAVIAMVPPRLNTPTTRAAADPAGTTIWPMITVHGDFGNPNTLFGTAPTGATRRGPVAPVR